jgi:lipopolysaccharide transport system ATP-binding protein
VGTGFHPELTGRENIFMNGAVLGMKRAEIVRKFDEIVAFAEVEKFLDTPVKFYSSGMYVRLAFAVAAHLEPEILIVDEVLAVGDAEFQKKCLGKMGDVAEKEGRTVLFVSHNMGAISKLCSSAIWINQGQLLLNDKTKLVISHYLTENAHDGIFFAPEGISNRGIDEFKLSSISIKNELQKVTSNIAFDEPFFIEIQYYIKKTLPYCRVGFLISTIDGTILFEAYDSDVHNSQISRQPGKYIVSCKIPPKLLKSNQYILHFNAGIPNIKNLLLIEGILRFNVEDILGDNLFLNVPKIGILNPELEWSTIN